MGADYTVGGLFVNWPILDCRTLAQIRSQVQLCCADLRFAKIREIFQRRAADGHQHVEAMQSQKLSLIHI